MSLEYKIEQIIEEWRDAHMDLIENLIPCLLLQPCFLPSPASNSHDPHHMRRLDTTLRQEQSRWQRLVERVATQSFAVQQEPPVFPTLHLEACIEEQQGQAVFAEQLQQVQQIAVTVQQTCVSWWRLAQKIHILLSHSLHNVGVMLAHEYASVWGQNFSAALLDVEIKQRKKRKEHWKEWEMQHQQLGQLSESLYSRWFQATEQTWQDMLHALQTARRIVQETKDPSLLPLLAELEILHRGVEALSQQAIWEHQLSQEIWGVHAAPKLVGLLVGAERWWLSYYQWFHRLVQTAAAAATNLRSSAKNPSTKNNNSNAAGVHFLLQQVKGFIRKEKETQQQQRQIQVQRTHSQESLQELRRVVKQGTRRPEDGWLRYFLQGYQQLIHQEGQDMERLLQQVQDMYVEFGQVAAEKEQQLTQWYHALRPPPPPPLSAADAKSSHWWTSWFEDVRSKPTHERVAQGLQDPQTLQWIANSELAWRSIRAQMIYTQQEIRRWLPQVESQQSALESVQRTLEMMEQWPERRQLWLDLITEESAFIQQCRDIRHVIFELMQDQVREKRQVLGLQVRCSQHALRLMIAHLFAYHFDYHRELQDHLNKAWFEVQSQVQDQLQILLHLNQKINTACPKSSIKMMAFETAVQHYLEMLPNTLTHQYHGQFFLGAQQHAQFLQSFMEQLLEGDNPLVQYVNQLDQTCQEIHELEFQIAPLLAARLPTPRTFK